MVAKAIAALLTLLALCVVHHDPAHCGEGDPCGEGILGHELEEELKWLRAETVVMSSIATGTPTPLHRSASVVTVITAEDIKAAGATTLDEALETVPGLIVIPRSGADSTISMRGIGSFLSSNAEVLVLINGAPFNDSFTGGKPIAFQVPVAAISRIEVIRGPGSALYGADAYAGVINIITKNAQEAAGTELGFRAGSFNTYDGWLQHGGIWSGWDVFFSVERQQTRGDRDRLIASDFQTLLDKATGTRASLAPGPADQGYGIIDGHLELARDEWTVRLWTWLEDDAHTGIGFSDVLSPENRANQEMLFTDATYRSSELASDWDVSARVSYLYLHSDYFMQAFAPGALLPVGANGNFNFVNPARWVTFPDGALSDQILTRHHTALDTASAYSGIDDHCLRLGAGIRSFVEENEEYKNFGLGVIDGSQSVVGSRLTDVTGTPYIFMEDRSRYNSYGFAQDEWSFAHDWQLIAGVRYDFYSDFGSTVNPRAALVWEARTDLTTKLLYGQAFRAPSFLELYSKLPGVLGNPDLQPETIETLELVLDYHPTSSLRTALDLFAYRADDLIEFVPDFSQVTAVAQNARDQRCFGLELEAEWKVTDTFRLKGSYSFQNSQDEKTEEPVPDIPRMKLHINPRWEFLPNWSLDGQLFWIGDREQAGGNRRLKSSDYALLNVIVRRKNIAHHWEVALAGRNLLDEDAREPAAVDIPGGIPLPGRSIYGEVRYAF